MKLKLFHPVHAYIHVQVKQVDFIKPMGVKPTVGCYHLGGNVSGKVNSKLVVMIVSDDEIRNGLVYTS